MKPFILFLSVVTIALSISMSQATAQTIATGHPTYSYSVGTASIAVAPGVTISDGTGTLSAATVSIQSSQPGDILTCTATGGLSVNFNGTTKTLSITGSATNSVYQTLLRSVRFETSTAIDGSRKIDFILGTGISLVIGGKEHIYEVKTGPVTWATAKTLAAGFSYGTEVGYLATVTSAEENAFLNAKVNENTWIGASDEASEGVWIWATGPEIGLNFWNGLGSTMSPPGAPAKGLYNNWVVGTEPNDSGNEDYAHLLSSGDWNDLPGGGTTAPYYIVEYGGYDSSPATMGASDYSTINVVTNQPPTPSADAYNVYKNTTRTIPSAGVLSNDTDPDASTTLTVNPSGALSLSHGSGSILALGGFTYTPTLEYTGIDGFTYRCWDGAAGVNADVTLTVVTPTYSGSGTFTTAGAWNGGYIPSTIDPDMDILVTGTLTTTEIVTIRNLTVNGTVNVHHNIIVENLEINTAGTINFANGATLTVNGNISNESRTGIINNQQMILRSGIKIN